MLLFLALLTFVIGNPEDDDKCSQYITTIMEAVSKGTYPSNLSAQTLLFSGKGLQDMGSYLVCRDQADYRYIHLRMTTIAFVNHIGFCIPSYCTQEYLQQYDEVTAATINNLMKFNYVAKADYQDPDLVYPEWSIGSTIMLLVVCLVGILNVAGSAMSIITKMNQQKLEKKQIKDNQPPLSPSTLLQNDVMETQEKGFMSGSGAESLLADSKQHKPKRQPMWMQLLKCFSFYDNYQKLFKIEEPKGENASFVIFNGVRALTIIWVIFGHDEMIRGRTAYNLSDVPYMLQQGGWITLCPAAYYAVDVFFFVGGFFSSVLVLEKILKMKRIRPGLVPFMWVHRILRVWPTYAFCLLVYWKLSIYWSDGPIWSEYLHEVSNCDDQWWRNLLFIDNMFTHTSGGLDYCFGWGWYLANDFQIFLITPIILIIYAKSRKVGLYLMISLLVGSLTVSYILAWVNNYHLQMSAPNATPQPDYQDNFYFKPWVRISPYMFGMLYGLVYRRQQAGTSESLNKIVLKIKTSVSIRALMYLIGIGITSTLIWMVVPLQKDMTAWPKQGHYFYQTFSRLLFVVGLAFCLTPALLGIKNDPARRFLGHPFWVPIARISFCMYLVQLATIMFTTWSSTQVNYYQHSHVIFFIITDTIYTMVIAAIISLSVEVPCMSLEKIFFEPKRSTKSQDKVQAEE